MGLVTDQERREVARSLTEAAKRVSRDDDIACVLNDILRGEEKRRGTNEDCAVCRRATLVELADLIEPGEPKVRCVAEVKIDGERLEKLAYDAAVKLTGVDRDALLALVEELETPCCGQLDPYLSDVARRIREALGVES